MTTLETTSNEDNPPPTPPSSIFPQLDSDSAPPSLTDNSSVITVEDEEADATYARRSRISLVPRQSVIVLPKKEFRKFSFPFIIVGALATPAFSYGIYYFFAFGFPPTENSEAAFKDTMIALGIMLSLAISGLVLMKMGVENMVIGFAYLFLLSVCIWFPAKAIRHSIICLEFDTNRSIKYNVLDPDRDERSLHPYWQAIQMKYRCCGTVEIDRVNDWPYFLNSTRDPAKGYTANMPSSCCTESYLKYLMKKYKISATESKESCGRGLGRTRNRGVHYRPLHIFERVFSGFYLSLTEVELKAMAEKFSAVIHPEKFLIRKLDAVDGEIKAMPAPKAFRQIWKSYYLDHVCNSVEYKFRSENKLKDEEPLPPWNGTEGKDGYVVCEDLTKENRSDLVYPGDWGVKNDAESLGWIESPKVAGGRCLKNVIVNKTEPKAEPTTTTTTTTTTKKPEKPFDWEFPILFENHGNRWTENIQPQNPHRNKRARVLQGRFRNKTEWFKKYTEYLKEKGVRNPDWKEIIADDDKKYTITYFKWLEKNYELKRTPSKEDVWDCINEHRAIELQGIKDYLGKSEYCLKEIWGDGRRKRSIKTVELGRKREASTDHSDDSGRLFDSNWGNASVCNKTYKKSRRNATVLGRELLLVLDFLTTYIYEMAEVEGSKEGKSQLPVKGTPVFWPVTTKFHKEELYPYKLAANFGRIPKSADENVANKLAKKMYYMSRGITENLLLEDIIHDKTCSSMNPGDIDNVKDKLAVDIHQRFRLWGPHIKWQNKNEGMGNWFLSFIHEIAIFCICISLLIIIGTAVIAFEIWQYYSRIKSEVHADLTLPEEYEDKEVQLQEMKRFSWRWRKSDAPNLVEINRDVKVQIQDELPEKVVRKKKTRKRVTIQQDKVKLLSSSTESVQD